MAEPDSKAKTKTRPRLGIVVRLAIYLPLLGFFGWRGYQRFALEREAADDLFRGRVEQWLATPAHHIVLPNGETLPMLTPEQAEAQGYRLPPSMLDESPAEPAKSAEPAEPTAPE